MKYIDQKNWPRRDVYELFSGYSFPYIAGTINLELGDFEEFIKKQRFSYYLALIYLATKAANDICEMRYRIQTDGVVEYELVHPSYTILDNNFNLLFCTVDFRKEKFSDFSQRALKKERQLKQEKSIRKDQNRTDFIYYSIYPWNSFTSLVQPVGDQVSGSIPRIVWGKAFSRDEKRYLPTSLQVHHGLLDGYHLARFAHKLEKMLQNPQQHLS
ncbi:MAG: CatA-like O-acetyltransferase [Bacillota bacterium]